MKVVIAVLLIALAANTAVLAQYVLDAKGRRYKCVPGDSSCIMRPPSNAPPQPLRRPKQTPPRVEDCGSRCDLLDRMK